MKKENEKRNDNHPLKNESMEMKVNYLKAISYFIVIDENVSRVEKEKLMYLIELLDCMELEEDILEFLENPSTEELFETFEQLGNNGGQYITDILSLKKEDNFNDNEQEFLKIIIPLLNTDITFEDVILFNLNYDKRRKIQDFISAHTAIFTSMVHYCEYTDIEYQLNEYKEWMLNLMRKTKSAIRLLSESGIIEIIETTINNSPTFIESLSYLDKIQSDQIESIRLFIERIVIAGNNMTEKEEHFMKQFDEYIQQLENKRHGLK